MGEDRRLRKSFLRASAFVLALAIAFTAQEAMPGTAARAVARVATASISDSSKVTLADTSIDGPALWTSDPGAPNLGLASVLAWAGTDAGHSLNVMRSSDGVHYGAKVTFAETSPSRPAVAAGDPPTTIVLAWIGTDTQHHLNLLCQGPACGTSGSGYKKLTLTNDTSPASPALTRFGSSFLLAWAGTDANHSLNVWPFSLTTSGSGFALGTKTVLGQFGSLSQPNLTVNPHTNQILMTWDATSPAHDLAFATSTNGTTWTHYGLNETSAAGPSSFVAAASGMPAYWMSWTGTDSAHSVFVRFTTSFPTWPASDITSVGETAIGGPALGFVGMAGETLLAWTGTDAQHHINVATLTSAGTPTLDQRISSYIAGLSTSQLIGQTIMMSVCTTTYSASSGNLGQALQQWDVGSAIIYTSCNGGPTEPATATGLQQLDQALQSNANHAGTLLIGIDEEGGTVDRLAPYYGSTPSAQSLAQSGNPQNAYNQATTDAGRMRSLGLNTDFAPVVDIFQSQFAGIGQSRTFGSTSSTVATYAGAFLDGLQQHGVAGALKHWPGLGASTGNPDLTLPTINQTQAQMRSIDFPPYSALLYEHPGMVMVTTVMAPAFDANNPADLSPTLVNGVLRGQIGYQGVVITDALGGQGLVTYMQQHGFTGPAAIGEAGVRAFLAGDDILLCPLSQSDLQAVVTAMSQALSSGRITWSGLNAAVHRITLLKIELGLMTVP